VNNLARVPFVVSAAAFTDVGQVRQNNEDYVAYHIPKEASVQAQYGALFLVCDGVGGQSAGEIASEHAARRILNDYYQAPAEQPAPARLLAAVQQANADILAQNAGQPDARKMTTTVVAGVIEGSQLYLVHAGDSRAYLVRAGQITQLTADHSWVAEMVRAGDLTAEEAQHHPWRNRITRSLGMREQVNLDAQAVDVALGDMVVLCSDGLTRHVADAEIAETVGRHPARVAAQTLIDLAKSRGGADNISVIVAQLMRPGAVQESAVPVAPAVVTSRRPLAWLPLAIAAGALLFLAAAGVIYTQTDLLRRSVRGTPTLAAPANAPSATPLAPAGTSLPAADPPEDATATPTGTTPAPTSTSRLTLTPTPSRSPTPPAPATASSTPAATVEESGRTPAHGLTAVLTYVPTPAQTKPAPTIPPSATAANPTAIPTPAPPTLIPTKSPPKKPTRATVGSADMHGGDPPAAGL